MDTSASRARPTEKTTDRFKNMKTRIILAAQAALAAATLSSQDLLVDFNSTNQSGGPHPQTGYQAYNAAHEAPADFIIRSFPAFGTSIDIPPAWPNTTDSRVVRSRPARSCRGR
ncbi:MAG: hypothetical protein CMP31_05290, partial [Roseibacillus sp.]|nr:hypothetical protein [Roseibacillus sp.]